MHLLYLKFLQKSKKIYAHFSAQGNSSPCLAVPRLGKTTRDIGIIRFSLLYKFGEIFLNKFKFSLFLAVTNSFYFKNSFKFKFYRFIFISLAICKVWLLTKIGFLIENFYKF